MVTNLTALVSLGQFLTIQNGPLTRYVKLRVAHAPGMPGTFSPPPTSKENASQRTRHPSRHVRDARAVMHVGISNLRGRGKRSRRMRNPQFYVSGKRPIGGAPPFMTTICKSRNTLLKQNKGKRYLHVDRHF